MQKKRNKKKKEEDTGLLNLYCLYSSNIIFRVSAIFNFENERPVNTCGKLLSFMLLLGGL